MAAIGLSSAEVEPFLTQGVRVACENSGSSVTISGDEDHVQNVIGKVYLQNRNVLARRLRVEIAYHSRESLPVPPHLRF